MVNYGDGKIYRIVCNTTGDTYYGSTAEKTLANTNQFIKRSARRLFINRTVIKYGADKIIFGRKIHLFNFLLILIEHQSLKRRLIFIIINSFYSCQFSV